MAAYAANSVASQSDKGIICCRQCSEPLKKCHHILPKAFEVSSVHRLFETTAEWQLLGTNENLSSKSFPARSGIFTLVIVRCRMVCNVRQGTSVRTNVPIFIWPRETKMWPLNHSLRSLYIWEWSLLYRWDFYLSYKMFILSTNVEKTSLVYNPEL